MIMKKENWRIYTNKEMYAIVRKPIIIETRRILGSVYDNENRKLEDITNKEMYTIVRKPIIIEKRRIWGSVYDNEKRKLENIYQ